MASEGNQSESEGERRTQRLTDEIPVRRRGEAGCATSLERSAGIALACGLGLRRSAMMPGEMSS